MPNQIMIMTKKKVGEGRGGGEKIRAGRQEEVEEEGKPQETIRQL